LVFLMLIFLALLMETNVKITSVAPNVDSKPAATVAEVMDIESENTVVYVYPESSEVSPGQNFHVQIRIQDVMDLYGWEFYFGWNTTILNLVDVEEGTFLKSGGDTFFTFKVNDTAGYLIADCTLLGDVSGVNGDGTLAIIELHAKTTGECVLDLYNTILVNSAEQSIPHTTVDGYCISSGIGSTWSCRGNGRRMVR